jgi:hypothetical protein
MKGLFKPLLLLLAASSALPMAVAQAYPSHRTRPSARRMAARHRPAHVLDRAGLISPRVWKAYRRFHHAKGASRKAAYVRFVEQLRRVEGSAALALLRSGLTAVDEKSVDVAAHEKRLWRFIRAIGAGERMVLHRVVEPYFRNLVRNWDTGSDLWEWSRRSLAHVAKPLFDQGTLRPSRTAQHRRSMERARGSIKSLVRALGDGASPLEQKALAVHLNTHIDSLFKQTGGNDLDLASLRPGTKRWMYWLRRFTRSPQVSFSDPKIIVDPPA